MQNIPKSFDVQMKYQDLYKKGKGIQDLTPLERIIIGAPYFNLFQEWLFRRRLLAVLKEGLIDPETDVKFLLFLEWYPKTKEGSQKLAILLSDAIIDFRDAHGYPRRRRYNP